MSKMITAQEAFNFYGKILNEKDRLEHICSKIMSVCQDETSLEIAFLSQYQIDSLEEKGFRIDKKTNYFVISWNMEAWKHW